MGQLSQSTDATRVPEPVRVSGVIFNAATATDRATGLLGFVQCVVGGILVVDGISVRLTTDGRISLSFPKRRKGDREYSIIRPLNAAARAHLEREILAAIQVPSEP